MRFSHWLIATIGACTAIGGWALSHRSPAASEIREPGLLVRSIRTDRLPERERALSLQRELRRASAALAAAQARDLLMNELEKDPAAPLITIGAVPQPIADVVAERAADVRGRLARPDIGHRWATGVIVIDRSWFRPGFHHMLPGITDGATCLTAMALSTSTPEGEGAIDELTDDLREGRTPSAAVGLRGPCGFFAAFGTPGRGVHELLERWQYDLIRVADWDRGAGARIPHFDQWVRVGEQPVMVAQWLDQRGVEMMACAAGRPDRCADLLLGNVDVSAPSFWDFEAYRPSLEWVPPAFETWETDYLFSDLVRDMGPERFREFWTSDQPADVALAAAGLDLGTWAEGWMQDQFGALRFGPSLRLSEVAWLLTFAALCVLLAVLVARRRGGSNEQRTGGGRAGDRG